MRIEIIRQPRSGNQHRLFWMNRVLCCAFRYDSFSGLGRRWYINIRMPRGCGPGESRRIMRLAMNIWRQCALQFSDTWDAAPIPDYHVSDKFITIRVENEFPPTPPEQHWQGADSYWYIKKCNPDNPHMYVLDIQHVEALCRAVCTTFYQELELQ